MGGYWRRIVAVLGCIWVLADDLGAIWGHTEARGVAIAG